MLSELTRVIDQYGSLLVQGTWETLVLIFVPTLLAYVIGLPIGVLLYATKAGSLSPHPRFNAVLGWIVNIGRSIPFIILLIALFPVTRVLVGTVIGIVGTIPPLTISAAPFVARMVEQSIEEIDSGKIEAAQACGASLWQTVMTMIIPESLPSLIRGLSITLIAIFGYSAMAGVIGSGGLGDIAIRYGYYRHEEMLAIIAIVISIVLIQIIQSTCDFAAKKLDKRIR